MKIFLYSTSKKIISRLVDCGFTEDIQTVFKIVISPDVIEKTVLENSVHGSQHILLINSEEELKHINEFIYDDYVSLSLNDLILTKRLEFFKSILFERTQSFMTEGKYKQLVEQFEYSVILLNEDCEIKETNSHFSLISGYSSEELIGKNINDLFIDTEFKAKLKEAENRSIFYEDVLTNKKGRFIPKEVGISKIKLEDNLFYLVTTRDIRQRLKALKKLEESEDRFRTIIKHSPNGMLVFKHNIITYINLLGIDILKGNYEDFIDQPFSKLIPSGQQKELDKFLLEAKSGNKLHKKEFSLIRQDGKEVWVVLSCIAMTVQSETNYFIIFQDLTKDKNQKIEVQNPDLRLREIQKIAQLGHWEHNHIKGNLYWSDEIYKIFGVEPQSFETSYKTFLEFVHPDDKDSVRDAYKLRLVKREPYEIVYRIILKNGTVKYLNEKSSTMFDKDKNPLRSLGTVMDISHTVRTEKALKQTEEKFKLFFENLDQPFIICKPKYNEQKEVCDFVISEVNPACDNIFMGNAYAVKNRTIREIYNDSDFWIEKYKYVLEKNETISFRKYSRDLNKHLDVMLFPVISKQQVAGMYTDVTEKVYAENQLQQLTTRLQTIQEYAHIGFFDVHIVTHRSKWSSVMLNIFEYPTSHKQSFETYLERIHPDDKEYVISKHYSAIKKQEKHVTLEYRLLFEDGRIKHIYSEFTNTFEGKTCLKTEGWLQDITDLRSAISALGESEEKLRMVTSGTKLGLWEWDLANKEFSIDQIGSQMLGYKPEDIFGAENNYISLIHPDDNELLNKVFKDFKKKNSEVFSVEYRVKSKSGKYKWVSCVGVASEFNSEGFPTKTIGFNQDISSRKRVESDLRESENKFRLIFEIENDSMFLVDCQDGRILETNDAATILFGYSRTELLQKDFYSLSSTSERLKKHIEHKKFRVGKERALLKNGTKCPIEISFTYFDWKDKQVVLASIRDVSERIHFEQEIVRAKEKAEESDRLKSAFLANMSHEIRTPLNAIVGFSRLLARKNYEENKRKIFIQDIQVNSNQLLTIINDILDISKIESGQFILNPEPICINNLIQEVHDSLEVTIQNKDLKLFSDKPLSDELVTICIDDVRLKQVLGNLLNNAIKFTEEGYIHFGYKQTKNDELTFFVKDTGIGIAEEKQKVIFEHFRQEDDTTTRRYGGTGLGLSISKSLIELMGGRIWVESVKGEGAEFFVSIPFKTVTKKIEEQLCSFNEQNLAFGFDGETILICDDHKSSFVFISEMFEGQNVSVIQAKNGEEAINICRENPHINLVLMDIQMGGLNGVQAMKLIKRRNADIPIVAQTAFAQKGDRERFMDEGFDEYITKPLDDRDLQSIFKRFLKRR